MGLTEIYKIRRINLGLNYNKFIIGKIIYDLSRAREVFFIFHDLTAIINK